MQQIRIGVLALQGAFEVHRAHVEAAGAAYVEVITTKDFTKIDCLILPGGESGTVLKLIETVGIAAALADFVRTRPTWGICAGAILLAKAVLNPSQVSFAAIDIEIERNAYGRQLESTEALVNNYLVSYIRAPRISSVGSSVNTFCRRDEFPTWVENDHAMITTFHPELNLRTPSPWHQRLVAKARGGTLRD